MYSIYVYQFYCQACLYSSLSLMVIIAIGRIFDKAKIQRLIFFCFFRSYMIYSIDSGTDQNKGSKAFDSQRLILTR